MTEHVCEMAEDIERDQDVCGTCGLVWAEDWELDEVGNDELVRYSYTKKHDIGEALANRVRARTGLTGPVRIDEESWDSGVCDTCSYPESGFSVWVGDKLVWPSEGKIYSVGGYVYADDDGHVSGDKLVLSWYGYFDRWLNGAYTKGDED